MFWMAFLKIYFYAVVKAVDEVVNRKRKAEKMVNSPSSVKTSGSSSIGGDNGYQLGMLPPEIPGRIVYHLSTFCIIHKC